MVVKHKNLFLYLTLACFLGIVLIFIFDGYMGVYDSLTVRSGEIEQRIEASVWERDYWSTAVEWGGKAFYHYELENRRFSSYRADVEVSVWHSQEKVADLISQELSLGSFDKGQLEWVVDMAEIVPDDASPELGYEFTLLINRDGIERRFVMHVRPGSYPIKAVPAPPD
jgi:hypothetical protein